MSRHSFKASVRERYQKLAMTSSPPLPDVPVEHLSFHQQVENTFKSVSGLVQASLQPLPTQTGDGTYITEPPSTGPLLDLIKTRPEDIKTIFEIAKAGILGKATNDRSYELEHIIKVCAIAFNLETLN